MAILRKNCVLWWGGAVELRRAGQQDNGSAVETAPHAHRTTCTLPSANHTCKGTLPAAAQKEARRCEWCEGWDGMGRRGDVGGGGDLLILHVIPYAVARQDNEFIRVLYLRMCVQLYASNLQARL